MIRTSWYNGGLEKKIGVWQCGDSETGKIIYEGTNNTVSINEHLEQGLMNAVTSTDECLIHLLEQQIDNLLNLIILSKLKL